MEDQDKTIFTCPWGTFAYTVLPFGLCNALATFQRAVIRIFFDLVNDCLEIYMDDFTSYGDSFEEALTNLEKVLKRCKEKHLSLNTEKCHMMMTKGVVLGHYISSIGIRVDPAKIEVILQILVPKTQKEVRRFLGHAGYYRRFIEIFSKIATPLFNLLSKEEEFVWTDNCQSTFANIK